MLMEAGIALVSLGWENQLQFISSEKSWLNYNGSSATVISQTELNGNNTIEFIAHNNLNTFTIFSSDEEIVIENKESDHNIF